VQLKCLAGRQWTHARGRRPSQGGQETAGAIALGTILVGGAVALVAGSDA
jgi:hypothetical protein